MTDALEVGWRLLPLGDAIQLQRGFDITKRDQETGMVPVVSSGGVSSFHNEARVVGPGVVIGRKGALGTVYYMPTSYWPHDTTLFVKDFGGNHPRFVCYLLKSLNLERLDVGSANPTLNRNHVHPIPILLPPIVAQQSIAAMLGVLDDKMEANRRLLTLLHAAGSSLCELHLCRHGKAWEYSWPDVRLADWLSVLETGRRPRGGVKGIASGVPSVGAESIVRAGAHDFSKTKFVPVDYYASMARGKLQPGDVLLYKDGGTPGNFIPHVSMTGRDFPHAEAAINEHVYRIRVRAPYSEAFLYFWLSSDRLDGEMRRRGTGVAIPGLNSSNVKALPFPDVPTEVLTPLQKELEPLLERLFVAGRENKHLTSMRDALLPELMSGRMRVPEAEEAVAEVL